MQTSAVNLAKLQINQNNACHLILWEGRMTSIMDVHAELETQDTCDRCLFRVPMYIVKCMNRLILDKNIIEVFDLIDLQHDVNTGLGPTPEMT